MVKASALRVPPCAPVARRTCCTCASCVGAAQSPCSEPVLRGHPMLAVLLHAKRTGYLWRQRESRIAAGPGRLKRLPPRSALTAQKALDELLELDMRLACEASGQKAHLHASHRHCSE